MSGVPVLSEEHGRISHAQRKRGSLVSIGEAFNGGPFTLYMTAGGGNKLPFGSLPRLILAWLCTEAVGAWLSCLGFHDRHPGRVGGFLALLAFRLAGGAD